MSTSLDSFSFCHVVRRSTTGGNITGIAHLSVAHLVFLRDFDGGFAEFRLGVAGTVNTAESAVSDLLKQFPAFQAGIDRHV